MKIMILVLSIITLSLVTSWDEEGLGRCGGIYGDCGGSNECCSKFGFCGVMDIHCHFSKGCQPQYGICKEVDYEHYDPDSRSVEDFEITPDGKCGPANGACPEGVCCSKEGECGTTDDHCLVTRGCKSLFGDCKDDSDSLDDSELPPEEIPENKGKNLSPDGRKMERNTKNEKIIWDYLNEKFGNKYATAALMGNIYSKTKLNPTYLDEDCLRKLHMSEKTYTRKTDKGKYKKFVTDKCQYGLSPRSSEEFKEELLDFAKSKKKSIGDIDIQIKFFWIIFNRSLSRYHPEKMNELQNTKSLQRATIIIANKYYQCWMDIPKYQDEFKERINNAAFYYNIYGK